MTDKFSVTVIAYTDLNTIAADPLFGGDDDGGDLFGGPVKKPEVKKAIPVKQEVKKEPAKQASGPLGDDDDDGDLFGGPVKKPEVKTEPVSKKSEKSSGPLDMNDDDDDLFGSGKPPASKPVSVIF